MSVRTPFAEEAEGHAVEPVADRARERDHEQQVWERHHDLRQPRDDRVRPAAEVTGDRPHRDPDHHADHRRTDRDLERHLCAVQEPQELVATVDVVGAEDEEGRAKMAGGADVRELGDPRPGADGDVGGRVDRGPELVVRTMSE